MAKIVGVRLKKAKDVCFYDSGDAELVIDDWVIVETDQGWSLARVVFPPQEAPAEELKEPLKKIVRKAFIEDIKRGEELEAKEKAALVECGKLVEKLKLPMRLLSADYDFDGKRVTISFRSEERVDFRELVRDLAGQLRARVELRQTRPRDEAKVIGGCGRCGRSLCCSSYLKEFAPVSIKMAKVQNLPLNPMKISGVCGRLMCCLVYENEFYQLMKGNLPRDNTRVSTATGFGKVIGNNPLKETVLVQLDDSEATVELPLAEISIVKPDQPGAQQPKSKENPVIREKRSDGRAPFHHNPVGKTPPQPSSNLMPSVKKAANSPPPAAAPTDEKPLAPSSANQPVKNADRPAEPAANEPIAPTPPAGPSTDDNSA